MDQNLLLDLKNICQQYHKTQNVLWKCWQHFQRNLLNLVALKRQRPWQAHHIENVWGPRVWLISFKIRLTVPIGTPDTRWYSPQGARPACPSQDPAAPNFSSCHFFRKDTRPVLESPEWALCNERTSSLVRLSRKKKKVLLKATTTSISTTAVPYCLALITKFNTNSTFKYLKVLILNFKI